jgi:hypothetical protein
MVGREEMIMVYKEWHKSQTRDTAENKDRKKGAYSVTHKVMTS